MAPKNVGLSVGMLVLCSATAAAVPALAGSSIVGSVAGSTNATIGGQPAIDGSTIFSGDCLKVNDGMAVVTLGRGNRAVFGRNSEVSFWPEGDGVIAHLASGSVSIFQPGKEQTGMRIKFGEMTIGPAGGSKTLGEVAMLGDTVVVRTKLGMMSVSFANGKTTQVPAGKALTLTPAGRAPREAAGSHHSGSNIKGGQWATLAAAGTAALLAGILLNKTDNATSAATGAGAAAAAAETAASNAATAANAAAAAASSAAAEAVIAETISCELLNAFKTYASPYVPPGGLPPCSCGGVACPG